MSILSRFLFVTLTASLMTIAGAVEQAKLKIATVNMQELFENHYRTKEVQDELNITLARVKKDSDSRLERITELNANLETLGAQIKDSTIAEAKRQKLKEEYQKKHLEGTALDSDRRDFIERKKQMINEQRMKDMKSILGEIRKLVEEQAKEGDYDYVFDKSGMSMSGIPVVLYTKDATDITSQVLKVLNKNAPAKAENDAPKSE